MIKRVALVLTLLFAGSVSAQALETENASNTNLFASSTPVVEFESATGTVVDETVATSSTLEVSPAEIVSTSTLEATSSTTTIEVGAFETSASSSSSSTQVTETEESTQDSSQDSQLQQLFTLVFAGFEKFVQAMTGWE